MAASVQPPSVLISEAALLLLRDPAQALPCDRAPEDRGVSLDHAIEEVARALHETGRSLSHLHVLWTEAQEEGRCRAYRDGVLMTGKILQGLCDQANEPP